jgi:hypothetical protein
VNVKVVVALLLGLLYVAIGVAMLTSTDRAGRTGFVFIVFSLYAFYHAWSAWGKRGARVQFRLRTLLLVMTVVAVLLGLIAYAAR